jgi:superfamily II DNA/RNA helicase
MKGILVKRLESSFFAFRQSIDRFILSYENFINMFETGTVYISKKVDVYDLLANDDIDKLEEFVDEDKANKYDSKDFKKDFISKLQFDLKVLQNIKELWGTVDTDPKLEKFIVELKKTKALKNNKIVIFTESNETGDYIYEALNDEFPNKVMFYSSKGGRHTDKKLLSNHNVSRDIIQSNYDPNRKQKEQVNDLRILIATDVLAEGINLHRSNVVVNYDLPWNPTRVLQRAGRVNRLGSKFDNVHIFNFFPTTQSDEHLGLEVNITNKIQMFHDILGEDAKYLSDGEEFASQELFNILNNKKAYTGEDEEGDSELKYLEMMRKIRDENPELFQKIKNLPKKARSGFKKSKIESNQLLTFFRIGKLKKFYVNKNGSLNEITFFDAVYNLECTPLTKRAKIPKDYYHLLQTNRARFELDTTIGDEPKKTPGGRSNVKYIEQRLKDEKIKKFKGFTDSDDEFLESVKNILLLGTMAKRTARDIKNELERTIDPLETINILRKHIRATAIENSTAKKAFQKREVILSGYLIK